MATITQIVAAHASSAPCTTCGPSARINTLECRPAPVGRTSSSSEVKVPTTVLERLPSAQPRVRREYPIKLSVSRTPIPPAPSRWRRVLTTVKAGLALGRKDS